MIKKRVLILCIFLCILALVTTLVFVSKFQLEDIAQKKYAKDMKGIASCDSSSCFQEFFEEYAGENGTAQAIDFFKKIIAIHPEYESDCHYMFHGIGHGEYKRTSNVQQALTLGSTTEVLMNIPTCGNGYYHGVIEGYVGEQDVDNKTLVTKLKSVCSPLTDNQVKIDCYHGLGHAILVHLHNQVQKAIVICDQVSPDKSMQSMCHTGIFMEMIRDESPDNKVLTFAKCESLPTEMQRAECFNQHSYLLNDFLNNKDIFIKNMLECEKKITNMEERIICIRKEKL